MMALSLACDRLHNRVEVVSEGPKAFRELCVDGLWVKHLGTEVGWGRGSALVEFVPYRVGRD